MSQENVDIVRSIYAFGNAVTMPRRCRTLDIEWTVDGALGLERASRPGAWAADCVGTGCDFLSEPRRTRGRRRSCTRTARTRGRSGKRSRGGPQDQGAVSSLRGESRELLLYSTATAPSKPIGLEG